MKRPEIHARMIVAIAALAAIGLPLYFWARTPLVHARMASDGGWSPDIFRARVGEPLHLRLVSDDVTHGFAVGQMPMQSVDVLPGKVSEVSLTFDKPGTYTFYCTRWCGLNHWRMRGTIEVTGGGADLPATSAPPLYVRLGLDLDASRLLPAMPGRRPNAGLVERQFAGSLPANRDVGYYRSHSPYQSWSDLRGQPGLSRFSDQDLWDMTASIWLSNTTPESLDRGATLFAQNCAACHGEQGAGNGVFAEAIAEPRTSAGSAAEAGPTGSAMGPQKPADFSDPARLLSASPALLQGKILRGGMGTGMPSWGPLFTQEQTWDLVAYLYSLQFVYH